jgi:DNA-binding transcriptional ArsR family regulator
MAKHKTECFSECDIELANLARALSHPARIHIVRELAAKDSCQCGELVSNIPLAQSTVSQHLKELQKAGLIKGVIDGPRSCYCLDTQGLMRLHDVFKSLFDDLGSGMGAEREPESGACGCMNAARDRRV